AQDPAVGRLAVDQALLHSFVQERPCHVAEEILVKQGDEAADLGPHLGGAVDQRVLVDCFLEIFADRPAVDEGDPPFGIGDDRCARRRVLVKEFVTLFPRVFAPQLEGHALFGEVQANLAAERAEGELMELPHGPGSCRRGGEEINRAGQVFAVHNPRLHHRAAGSASSSARRHEGMTGATPVRRSGAACASAAARMPAWSSPASSINWAARRTKYSRPRWASGGY